MKTRKWACIALSAVALTMAGIPSFANGFIKSPELLEKIQIGVTTSQQVTDLLGLPMNIQKFPRRGVEAWDYRVPGRSNVATISIEIDSKGVVSNVQRIVYYGP